MKSLFTLLMILSLLSAASQAPFRSKIHRNTSEHPVQLEWESLCPTSSRLAPGFLLTAPLF